MFKYLFACLILVSSFFWPALACAEDDLRVSAPELKAMLDSKTAPMLLDMRSGGAYKSSTIRIPGDVRMPAQELEGRLSELSREKGIVAYCT